MVKGAKFYREASLPDGLARFGRRVGGHGGDVKVDVFFSVPLERVEAAFDPDGSWGWGAMLEPPKSDILAAAAGKTIPYVFPDGADHRHIKAY